MELLNGIGAALNGFDLSQKTPAGAQFKILGVDGFEELPGTTGKSNQNAYADGGWVDEAFVEPKSVRLRERIWAGDRQAATAALRLFNQAVPVRVPAPLVVLMDGEVRHRLVRQEGEPSQPRLVDGYVLMDVQLSDPFSRILSGDGTGPTFVGGPVLLPKKNGGQRYGAGPDAARYPLRTVATVLSGAVTLATEGNAAPPVLIRVKGPLPGFTLTTDDGQSMTYTEALSTGQWVDINLDGPRSYVKINGTVNRRNKLTGNWIIPAHGTIFRFTSSVENTTASMTVYAYSAWR